MKTQPNRPARDRKPRLEISNSSSSIAPMTGLVRDTVVLTRSGEVLVQHIQADHHIVTRDAGLVRVQIVVHQHVMSPTISVAAGSLGDTRPEHEMILPANQQILIRDWRAQALFGCNQALVPASSLVDGEYICHQGQQMLDLYSVHLERLHVIYAGGLEVASATETALNLRSAA
ncbi:hypothetical protein EBB79_15095 [Parasedimentitalea marina]|uniref:Hedgehog/Intein (Hint) domain-containing protein n=2 Tax=Parasedimentitalea marina TaxID=2483033 RepID=A0A3T0N4W0_9RHOB|nr:hypothetical protein EBB79_15095 [Parasedimentitalea marina]